VTNSDLPQVIALSRHARVYTEVQKQGDRGVGVACPGLGMAVARVREGVRVRAGAFWTGVWRGRGGGGGFPGG